MDVTVNCSEGRNGRPRDPRAPLSSGDCLYTAESIQARIREMGAAISSDYRNRGRDLAVVAMLRGSLYFVADLTRAITLPLTFDFIGIGSYSQTQDTGVMRITKDLDIDIRGRDVLVLEEIVRSGLTTNYMIQNLENRKAASIRLAALFVCEEQNLIDLPIAYRGFAISRQRLVGYGMDERDHGRNLPSVYELIRREAGA